MSKKGQISYRAGVIASVSETDPLSLRNPPDSPSSPLTEEEV